jgi:L-asparaginase
MKKILVIGTGGTIGCVRGDNIHLDKPFKILDYMSFDDVEFECVSPFTILSENMDFEHLKVLIDFIGAIDFNSYNGVILLHGSDTLKFSGSIIANAFYDKPIVLVASDKPVEDKTANGFKNFEMAVNAICDGINAVYISYDEFYRVENKKALEHPVFTPKNILVIPSYVGIDYSNYNLDSVDIVLHTMYHSATAPQNVKDFIAKCKEKNIPFYFVTENSSASYESSKDFENIIFNSTLESAYARILLS